MIKVRNVKLLIKQTWPVFVSQLAVTLYGVIDTFFASHLSPDSLVIVSVSSNIYSTIYITFSSILYILMPYVSQFFGANNKNELSDILIQGIWLALFLCVPLFFFLIFPEPFLYITSLSGNHLHIVKTYLLMLLPGIPALMMLRVYFAYCTGVLKPENVMYLNIAGLVLKFIFSYVLINGFISFPAFGVYGCAISTVTVSWVTFIIAMINMGQAKTNEGENLFARFARPRFQIQLELLKKGFPIGITFFIDFASLTFIGLLVARMGVIVTGGYQIASNISLLCYLVPLSVGSAASVLLAKSIGEKNLQDSKNIRVAALLLTLAISFIISLMLFYFSENLALLYSEDSTLVKTAAAYIQLISCYHFFDALLTVTSGLLRGYKRTSIPTVIYGLSLWVFGLGGGYYLAFIRDMGAEGFWYGLTFAAFFAAVLMGSYLSQVEKKEMANLL
jgi:MATE family multidrug resistance protein